MIKYDSGIFQATGMPHKILTDLTMVIQGVRQMLEEKGHTEPHIQHLLAKALTFGALPKEELERLGETHKEEVEAWLKSLS